MNASASTKLSEVPWPHSIGAGMETNINAEKHQAKKKTSGKIKGPNSLVFWKAITSKLNSPESNPNL